MPPIKWTLESLLLESMKYKTRTEFLRGSQSAYQSARNRGILDEVCAHMPKRALHPSLKWTDETILQEAQKYKSRGEFSMKSPSAYSAARIKGILDEVCAHMSIIKNLKWTFEVVSKEAQKYKSISDFRKKSRGAYRVAHAKKWLKKITTHMKKKKVDILTARKATIARRHNVTGLYGLSIGKTKNSQGFVLTRYCVNYKEDGKPRCKSFFFGVNIRQKTAFKAAVEFMKSERLLSVSMREALAEYDKKNHDELI